MDAVNYALSKRMSWNDLKDKPFYSSLELIKQSDWYNGDPYLTIDLTNASVQSFSDITICVEINNTRIPDLSRIEGDGDGSKWADGNGFGFYGVRTSSLVYRIYIDEARYGSVSDAIVNVYKQTVEKTLFHKYLPTPTHNSLGGVKASVIDNINIDEYIECFVDPDGSIYSKVYTPAKIYEEMSITTFRLATAGDHFIFTDSIEDEIINAFPTGVSLDFPIHAWIIKYDISSTPYTKYFLIETANQLIAKIGVTSTISSVTILSELKESVLCVTITRNDDGTYSADKTFEEISEAYKSGRVVQCVYNTIVLSLKEYYENNGFIFYSDTYFSGSVFVFLIENNNEIQFGEESPCFQGSTSTNSGYIGFVPAPSAGDQDKFLKGDGTWGELPLSFNDSGELVVTLNGISKTFVPKS